MTNINFETLTNLTNHNEELLIINEEGLLESFFGQEEIMPISEEILKSTVRSGRCFDMGFYVEALDEYSQGYEENENATTYFFQDNSCFMIVQKGELETYTAYDKDHNLLYQFELSKTGTIDIITPK